MQGTTRDSRWGCDGGEVADLSGSNGKISAGDERFNTRLSAGVAANIAAMNCTRELSGAGVGGDPSEQPLVLISPRLGFSRRKLSPPRVADTAHPTALRFKPHMSERVFLKDGR